MFTYAAVVPGRTGSYAPGSSVAYENQALLASLANRNKRKVVSSSRVTLPVNFACKPELSFNPLARVSRTVGLPYLLVNRALENYSS